MNNLRAIRKKYNMTAGELADKLGVTKQAVSAWERGIKDIPKDRIEEIATIFMTETEDISEVQKYLVEFSHEKITVQQRERISTYADLIGNKSFEEKYKGKRITQKELEKEIHKSFEGPVETSLYMQIDYIERGIQLYKNVVNILRLLNTKARDEQQAFFSVIMTTLDGLRQMMGEIEDENAFVKDETDDAIRLNVEKIRMLLTEQVQIKQELLGEQNKSINCIQHKGEDV